MTTLRRGAFAAATLALALASPAAAQDYRSSVGWNAGAVWTSRLNAGAEVDGFEGEARRLEPGTGWVFGVQGDHWLWGGILGVRVGGGYTRHYSLRWNDRTRQIGNWQGEASLVTRFLVPDPERVFSPYVAAGVGGVRYGLGRGDPVSFPEANAFYRGRQRYELAANGALGLDVITRWIFDDAPLFFRVEAANQVAFDSPLRRLTDRDDFGPVHNVRFTIGLHAGLGSLERTPPPAPVPVVAGR
jgi:hypothetical protein